MWISSRNKGEAKMKKNEFAMENEKITEYSSESNDYMKGSNSNANTCLPSKSNLRLDKVPEENERDIIYKAKDTSYDKYMESQDTTIGFYSDEELKKSDCIYNFSDAAKAFVANMHIYRYTRFNLIRTIADLFNMNDCYGVTITYNTVICRNAEKIISECNIDRNMYDMLAKAVLLHISNEFGHVDYWNYLELKKYPDRLFYDWDMYLEKEEYKFYSIRKYDESFESYAYKVRRMKFMFNTKEHIQIGVSIGVNLLEDTSSSKNIDFLFNTSSIGTIMENLDRINAIKGSY